MKKEIILNTLLCVTSLAVLVGTGVNIVKHSNEINDVKSELSQAKDNYQSKKQSVNEKIVVKSSTSTNAKLRYLSQYKSRYEAVNSKVQTFFNAYYSWNDGKEYANRKNSLKGIASPELLDNKRYFDKGLDSSGNSYIDALGLKAKFDNAATTIEDYSDPKIITAIVSVTYSSQNSNGVAKKGMKWFKVKYDLNRNYIASIESIYFNKNVANNNGTSS